MILLAKSKTHGELSLEAHLLDTEQAATNMFAPSTRWGIAWPRFFRLDDQAAERCLLEMRIAALFHDIGKANQEFQAMVQNRPVEQTLRHEHLSALVLALPKVREWLENSAIDVDVVTAAVLSHHLKAAEDGDWSWGQARHAPTLSVQLDDEQVVHIFARVAALLNLSSLPTLPSGSWLAGSGVWHSAVLAGRNAARLFGRRLRADPQLQHRLMAVKTGLICADAVSSGVVRVGEDIGHWLQAVAHQQPLTPNAVLHQIIEPRLEHLSKLRARKTVLHDFQVRVSTQGARVLLLAACGSGKTLAAWAWANEQAKLRQVGRVIFLYPTRGTATEGFRDYAAWAPETDVALMHGTSKWELERMLENPPESAKGRNFSQDETEARLFALGFWSKRYFAATVDQFLAALEHRYESICLLPALADAVVIIDEVHSFDRRMFGNLVSFLRHFDVPVLCMTATLPASRRAELEGVGLSVFPSEVESKTLADLKQQENARRYVHRQVRSEEIVFDLAVGKWREGRRVLCVVNTVARAQSLADRLEATIGSRVLCYHSRYRLIDRQAVHQQTIAAFQQRDHAAIAVTTQVCEMSLDLDAEVLLTEFAPITSLVQRFGRANRHLAVVGAHALLVTWAPPKAAPYELNELANVPEFLAEFGDTPFSQAELANALERHARPQPKSSDSSALLGGGYYAVPRDFRESDEFAKQCVLSDDEDAAATAWSAKQPIDGLIVPVPRQFAGEPLKRRSLPRWLFVAQSSHYRATRGFIAPT